MPETDIQKPTHFLKSVSIALDQGLRMDIAGAETKAPGLLVTPLVRGGTYTGEWTLTQAETGRRLPGVFVSAMAAFRYAELLAEIDIDWTADPDVIRERAKEHAQVISGAKWEAAELDDGAHLDPDAIENPPFGSYQHRCPPAESTESAS